MSRADSTPRPAGREIEKSEQEWAQELSPEQFDVLRRAGTEPPFAGRYVYAKESGAYRCAACANELFSSDAKFDSGTGWPSFTEPTGDDRIELREDRSHGVLRTEVLCRRCGSHLGHVFNDGPGPGAMRYCINSVALDLASPGGAEDATAVDPDP